MGQPSFPREERTEVRCRTLRRSFLSLRFVSILLAAALVLPALGYALVLRARGVEFVDFANELNVGGEPRFAWRSVGDKHWQVVAMSGGVPTTGEPVDVTDAREGTGAGCPAGMVRVSGNYRLDRGGEGSGDVERLQDAACTDWLNTDFPARCRTFDAEKLAKSLAPLKTRALDFCIDRFEYPNVAGQNPLIVVTFGEAEGMCKKDGKRLCSESEWTFACEGEETRPYPYGFERDTTACVVDRSWRPFSGAALAQRSSTRAQEELDRLWQGEPSGSRNACKSPFGVYDMTGNVDEWTRNARTTGYASVMKGGYWGPVRARCRPATRAHDESFVAYQQGFRCCAESDGSTPRTAAETPIVEASLTGDAGAAPRLGADAGATAQGAADAGADASVPADAGPSPADDRPTPMLSDDRSDDELQALARSHTGLFRCAASPVGVRDRTDGGWRSLGRASGWAVAVVALVASRRRRRRFLG